MFCLTPYTSTCHMMNFKNDNNECSLKISEFLVTKQLIIETVIVESFLQQYIVSKNITRQNTEKYIVLFMKNKTKSRVKKKGKSVSSTGAKA